MIIATLTAVTLLAVGVRIPVAIVGGTLVLLALGYVDASIFPQLYLSHIDSYTLLAVPMYLLAGALITRSEMGETLFGFAQRMLHWLPGAMGHATLGATAFMAGMSGSSAADVAAVGSTAIPAAERLGYRKQFIGGVVAAGGTLGILIPPSLTMILYGALTRTSVTDLFIAGLLPAALSIVLTMIVIAYLTPRHAGNYKEGVAVSESLLRAFGRAFPALMMPVIIMGGIYSGLVTPTEAGALAVVYAVFIGFATGKLDLPKVRDSLYETGRITTMLFLIIAAASVFGQVMTLQGVPAQITDFVIANFGGSQILFLLFVNVLFFVLGAGLESFSIMIMMIPLLFPTAVELGVHPVHFAVIVTVNIELGLLTPPYGTNLFTVAAISNLSIGETARAVVPYLVMGIFNLALITYIPWFSLALLG